MENDKWMFNPRNQAYYEESYITKCQSLLNLEMKWHGYQKWKLIIRVEYSKLHPRRVNVKVRSNWQPSWSQKEERWQQSIWCKLKLKKLFFMFLEYRNTVLLRGVCGWSENNQVKFFSSIQNRNVQPNIVQHLLKISHSSKNTHRNPWLDNVRSHWTMSDLTGHFRTYSRKPRFLDSSNRTMSGIWIWA
jgi:hypothetical protein